MQLFVPLLRLIVKINKNKAINRKIVIQLKDINKTYNNGAPLHVLKGINLDIQKGEFVSIMGASGSGKSTFLRLIAGIYKPDKGNVYIDGIPVYEHPEVKNKLAFVPDDLYFVNNSSMKRMAGFYNLSLIHI